MGDNHHGTSDSKEFEALLEELKQLAQEEDHCPDVEAMPLDEVRGHDVWTLYTNLKAVERILLGVTEAVGRLRTVLGDRSDLEETIDEADQGTLACVGELVSELGDALADLEGESFERLEAVATAVAEEHDATRSRLDEHASSLNDKLATSVRSLEDQLNKGFETIQGKLAERWDDQIQHVDDRLTAIEEMAEQRFDETEQESDSAFGTTWEMLSKNSEVTNERPKTEVQQLHQNLTQVLDKRFQKIDQRFAVLRVDLKVLKSLQTEQIKEHTGRPELAEELPE